MKSLQSMEKTDEVSKNFSEKYLENKIQIQKDLDRTFPKDPYFGKDKPGRKLLKQLLKVLAYKYLG